MDTVDRVAGGHQVTRRIVSLCAGGVDGLAIAVERHLGAVSVAQADINKHTEVVRALRWPHAAQMTADLRAVRGGDFPACEGIVGGFPCQDLSVAGNGAGLNGSRSSLFFDVVRLFVEARAAWGLLENVPRLLSRHRDVVERHLGWAGYGVTWCKVSAAHAGAPHLRRRVFLLVVRGAAHGGVVDAGKTPPLPLAGKRWTTPKVRDAGGDSPAEYRRKTPNLAAQACARWPTMDASVANDGESIASWEARRAREAAKGRNGNGFGEPLAIAVRRWPTPTAGDAKGSGGRNNSPNCHPGTSLTDATVRQPRIPDDHRLSPAWVETLMGLPVGWTDPGTLRAELGDTRWPALRGLPQEPWEPPRTEPKGDPWRTKRLKMLGNAVVWQQAVMALELMDAKTRIRDARAAPPEIRGLFG